MALLWSGFERGGIEDEDVYEDLVFARVAGLEAVANLAVGDLRASLSADVAVTRRLGALLYAPHEGIGRGQAIAALNGDQRIARRIDEAAPDAAVIEGMAALPPVRHTSTWQRISAPSVARRDRRPRLPQWELGERVPAHVRKPAMALGAWTHADVLGSCGCVGRGLRGWTSGLDVGA